ncbi:hypothetical protein BHM03_00033570 [Ensete ventricosum]|uniref:Uncharacterized protein n=1 Tax=Ensete ventricosum TaxID=4639 RepID=A0A427AR89_ENSVE|nr:hypothetical protein B296_00015538 [Ensete ventricosum]RZS03388.1 hypothetical protein BHM03_00033570 [Ensete ventricosum]
MAVAAVPMAVPFGLIFLLSGLILNILQAVIFITLRPLSRNLYRRINKVLVELLMLQLIWLADWWAGLKIQLYGDSKTFELLGKD